MLGHARSGGGGHHCGAGGDVEAVGTVAAGAPIEAVEDTQLLSLSSHFAPDDNIFALQVKGDSMLDDDIRDGDYVICRSTLVADNGRLVIAIVDNENATIKRVYKEKTQVSLQPSNDNSDPLLRQLPYRSRRHRTAEKILTLEE